MRACAKGHFEIVELLVENKDRKIDIYAADDDGINALQVAYEGGHTKIFELLKKFATRLVFLLDQIV